jgi:hypothetical protein
VAKWQACTCQSISLETRNVRSPSLPCGNVELLEEHAIKKPSSKMGTRNFLYLRHHFNNCECSASGGNIWELKWHEL